MTVKSPDMMRRILRNLQRAKKFECLGRSSRAAWRKEGNTL